MGGGGRGAVVLRLDFASALPGGLVKIQILVSPPEFQFSFGCGPRTCLSNKFPDGAGSVGLGTTLWDPLAERKQGWSQAIAALGWWVHKVHSALLSASEHV